MAERWGLVNVVCTLLVRERERECVDEILKHFIVSSFLKLLLIAHSVNHLESVNISFNIFQVFVCLVWKLIYDKWDQIGINQEILSKYFALGDPSNLQL